MDKTNEEIFEHKNLIRMLREYNDSVKPKYRITDRHGIAWFKDEIEDELMVCNSSYEVAIHWTKSGNPELIMF